MKRPLFLYLSLAVAVLAIGVGLYMSGSPTRARAQRYDQQRTNDLQQISYALDQYWMTKSSLPATLEDLLAVRDQYYVSSIRDPRTQEVYEYRRLTPAGTESYELCAVFETETGVSSASLARPIDPSLWQHGVGRTCFPLQVRGDGRPR
jgi:Bacterial type II secretion system protein G.